MLSISLGMMNKVKLTNQCSLISKKEKNEDFSTKSLELTEALIKLLSVVFLINI